MKKLFLFAIFLIALSSQAQKRTIIMPDGNSLLVNIVKPDKQGKHLYTAEAQKCIMWDIKTGKQLYTFRYNAGDAVMGVDINPAGDKLAIIAGNQIEVFSTTTGQKVAGTTGFNSFTDLVFSADGNWIYAMDYGIHKLDANTLEENSNIKSTLWYKTQIWLISENQALIASQSSGEIVDLNTGKTESSFILNGDEPYVKLIYMPFQKLLIGVGSRSDVDFYDIYTGTKKGSVKKSGYAPVVIPSINSKEILALGSPGTVDGFDNLDVFSTETFTLKTSLPNTGIEKYHPASGGYFDGLKGKAWLIAYNRISLYDIGARKTVGVLEGKVAQLGMDTFNDIEYNYSTGRLHITTDDHNQKTIDIYRMVPYRHNDLGFDPDAVAVSPTGDSAAVFNNNSLALRNFRTGKNIRADIPVGVVGSLYRNSFFFSNDGKNVFYSTEDKDKVNQLKVNISTGVKTTLFSAKGFGNISVHPDKTMMAAFESAYQVNVASVWDLKTGQRIFSHEEGLSGYIALSYDKKRVLVWSINVAIYDIATKQALVKDINIPFAADFGTEAVNSDLSVLITGSRNGEVAVYNIDGTLMYKLQAHTSTVRKIYFSPDNKLFYTVSYDNTIKVWETANGRLIGSLYLFKDSNDFVFLDEEGRFDGTPLGIQNIYSVVNQNFLPLDALFEKYYTPNLYARSVAMEAFPPIDQGIIHPAPEIRITYASTQRNLEVEEDIATYTNTTGTAEITANATAPGDALDEIRLFHNGKIVTLTTRNLIVEEEGKPNSAIKRYTVSLLPGVNKFRGIALNSQRTESKPDEIEVNYVTSNTQPANKQVITIQGEIIDPVDKSATLYLVVVGINKYQNPSMSLNYALADATAFKAELEKDAKTVISQVSTSFVTDESANRDGIINAFMQIQQVAKPKDLFIFYYAGHGVIGKDKEFYLVPNDVSDLKNVQSELVQKGIPAKLLQQYAIDIAAQKQLFILDACQSAGAFNEMLSADGDQQKSIAVVSRSTGTHWMAASGAQQYANEFSQLGHGAFTYVLLEALKGSAAADKMITVNGLKNYLQQEVPELMKKYSGTLQYPASYGFGNDFPVEIVK